MLRTLLFLVLASGIAGSAVGQEKSLAVGDKAPAFQAPTADGDIWKSSDVVGDKYLVVYFYPAAMTGGCTKQACAFRDDRTRLDAMGAQVVGVSGDSVEGLKVFKRTHNLNFPLLSDADGSLARAFGVPVGDGGKISREIGGERVELERGVTTSRWTFIIDKDGKIVYRDTEVDAEGDSQAVISALQKLQG